MTAIDMYETTINKMINSDVITTHIKPKNIVNMWAKQLWSPEWDKIYENAELLKNDEWPSEGKYVTPTTLSHFGCFGCGRMLPNKCAQQTILRAPPLHIFIPCKRCQSVWLRVHEQYQDMDVSTHELNHMAKFRRFPKNTSAL